MGGCVCEWVSGWTCLCVGVCGVHMYVCVQLCVRENVYGCVYVCVCVCGCVCVSVQACLMKMKTADPCPLSLQLFRRVIDSSLALSKSSRPGQDPPTVVASMKASPVCQAGCSVV